MFFKFIQMDRGIEIACQQLLSPMITSVDPDFRMGFLSVFSAELLAFDSALELAWSERLGDL